MKLIDRPPLVAPSHVVVRQQYLFLLVSDALALVDAAECAVVTVLLRHVRAIRALAVARGALGYGVRAGLIKRGLSGTLRVAAAGLPPAHATCSGSK